MTGYKPLRTFRPYTGDGVSENHHNADAKRLSILWGSNDAPILSHSRLSFEGRYDTYMIYSDRSYFELGLATVPDERVLLLTQPTFREKHTG